MTPTTLATLFAMERKDITLSGDTLALNIRLKLPPWMPPAVEVWAHRTPPAYMTESQRADWLEVLRLLDDLHAEYQRRQNDD